VEPLTLYFKSDKEKQADVNGLFLHFAYDGGSSGSLRNLALNGRSFLEISGNVLSFIIQNIIPLNVKKTFFRIVWF